MTIQPVGSGLLRIDAHAIPPYDDEPSHLHVDLAMGFVAADGSLDTGDASMAARWARFDDLADEVVKLVIAGCFRHGCFSPLPFDAWGRVQI